MSRVHYIWMVIWLVNIKLCNSSGKLGIRFLRFKNNKRVNNGDCCDNFRWCLEACDIYLEICVTEIPQAKCNVGKFRTKVLGKGSFTFPGIGGDLGNGKKNPLEYSFQKWQGFSLAIEIWDYDSGFLKGSSDFVDSVDLDINYAPGQNSTSASNKAKRMASNSSPNERYIDLQIRIYCDDNYLLPDCARECTPRDDALGHYTCDYVRGLVLCNQYWYGDRCTQYCRPRNDGLGNYTCDKFGAKICAGNWFGGNCSTFCKNTDDMTGHYKCDGLTGNKVCLPNWHGKDCLVFCKAQDSTDGHYSCNKTSGGEICLRDWYGPNCTKYCSPQNDRLLGHFKCDVTGDKVCLPGWRGVNCTQGILPTVMTRRSTAVQPSYNIKSPQITKNTNTQTPPTTSHAIQSTRFAKTSLKTSPTIKMLSPIMSSSWNINQLNPTSTVYFESFHVTSKHGTTPFISPSIEKSKQFSITNEMTTTKERQKTSIHYHKTQTFNEFDFKTLKTQTASQKKVIHFKSVISSTETLKAENPSKIPQADTDQNTPIKAQSSLAINTYSHSASGRNSQSKSLIENGTTEAHVTETLATRNSISLYKTHRNFSTSTNDSTSNFTQTLTDTFYHKRSIINPSSSFIKETIISERTKVSLITKNIKSTILTQTTTTAGISGVETSSPVSATRSVVMTSSSNPVSSTRSVVLTSSSNTTEMNGGKILKKDSFVLVFFPTVVFMMAVGLGICIKMKQKKLILRKVVPVNDHLLNKDKTERSSQIFKIPHIQSQQELLQMDVLSNNSK